MNKLILLEIDMSFGETVDEIHPVVLKDDTSCVLVDCGYVGSLIKLEDAFRREAILPEEITHIILSHQDHDHVGAAAAFKRKYPGVKLLASAEEAPYIDGTHRSLRLEQAEQLQGVLPQEMQEFGRAFLNLLRSVEPVPIDQILTDGELLPFCGGCEVLMTPGHTPGHLSLYLKELDTIIAGDAMALEDGQPVIANPQFTLDLEKATTSMQRLLEHSAKRIICYHGGILLKENEHIMLPRLDMELQEFPETDELPSGVRTVQFTDNLGYGVEFLPNIPYIKRAGTDLTLQLLIPDKSREGKRVKCPTIVFIQGSAWRKQSLFCSLSKLIRMAERGYVVAIVEYRPSDAAMFPAQIEDAKAAYRYLQKNCDKYFVDTENMVFWGDSSGGHTALVSGITGNDYPITEDYQDQEINPRCIIDWYGPTEIYEMSCYPSIGEHDAPDSPEGMLIGGVRVSEHKELAERTNPASYLSKDLATPPILIMHGGSDGLVHFNQSCRLYAKLMEFGKEVEFVKLLGANHGFMGFNSVEALDMVDKFIRKHLTVVSLCCE